MRDAGVYAVLLVMAIRPLPATQVGAELAPFVDATTESGLGFAHINGASGELLLPEVIGAGGALFDYDNDGDLDLFAVQGGALGPASNGRSGPALRGRNGLVGPALSERSESKGSRLFRNDLGTGSSRSPRFTDVTGPSGVVVTDYGMGAATGDIDNDGWVDLYVTALGANRMLRNNRNGTFSDVTMKSGTGDNRWSTSATFFDYDRDGWLDLFVAHYVNFTPEMKRSCFSAGSAPDYCNPVVYDPVPDRLLRNNRDGTFSDVSVRAGLTKSAARGLGVLASDFNGDGWTDLYVANDGDPNQLWINEGGSGTFRDGALLSGVAVNRMGQAQGSMGVDAGDVDGDGDDDLFVTNLDNEGNALYRSVGKGLFEERTVEAGLFALGFTGFGTRFLDYDNDGWSDLVVVNGAVRHLTRQVQTGDPYPLRQRNQLFRNDRGRRFVEMTAAAGQAFTPLHVARGIATGDLDNDGDIDLVIFNNNGPARVLLNEAGSRRHWIGVRAVDDRYRRDALQARVVLSRGDGRDIVDRIQADGSYCTAGDPRVVFGLGDDRSSQTIRVHWAGGGVEEFRGLAVDRYWILERGKAARTK